MSWILGLLRRGRWRRRESAGGGRGLRRGAASRGAWSSGASCPPASIAFFVSSYRFSIPFFCRLRISQRSSRDSLTPTMMSLTAS